MILAIDTATRMISVALAEPGQVVAEAAWQSENNHTMELAPAVARLLNDQPIDAIAVAIGPGSFTGVRIGLGFAKGLALARSVPLIGVRTFEIAVYTLPLEEREAVAVVQAGRGRVIWSRCSVGEPGWMAASDGDVGTWADVAGAATGLCVVGEIDPGGSDSLQAAGVRFINSIRQAQHLAAIGWARWQAGQLDSAATLRPIYAHQPKSGT
jgi:tRNA threonylcarbamoyladenosine biosynthesis protein TsaB